MRPMRRALSHFRWSRRHGPRERGPGEAPGTPASEKSPNIDGTSKREICNGGSAQASCFCSEACAVVTHTAPGSAAPLGRVVDGDPGRNSPKHLAFRP